MFILLYLQKIYIFLSFFFRSCYIFVMYMLSEVFSSIVSFCNIQYQTYLNKIPARNWHKIISPKKALPCLPFIPVMRIKTSAFGAYFYTEEFFYSLSGIVQVISHPKLIVFHNRSRQFSLFDQSSFYMFKIEEDLYFIFIIVCCFSF